MNFRRRSLPGIDELIQTNIETAGNTGKIIKLIKERDAERKAIVNQLEKLLADWSKKFTRLNQIDGELDAYESMVLEKLGKCDIVNEIVKGSRKAADEKAKRIQDMMGSKNNMIPSVTPVGRL